MVGAGTGIMLLVMFALLILGVPIGVSIGIAILVLLQINPVTPTAFVAQSMYSQAISFNMIALPFFMVSGNIMDTGGLSKRLVNVANELVGGITGSLGLVTVIACMFFGAISGSAPATVAAIGTIMIPMMIREGYDKYYATGLVAVAGGLGVIVPPSYPMVLYGCTNDVSIGTLFAGGIGPAVLVGLLLIAFNYYFCKKKGLKGTHKFNFIHLLKAIWDAKWALIMPLIILGGIYSGVFTATESAVVATVYGILIGKFVYKELSWKALFKNFYDTAAFVGGTMFTFIPAGALGAIFALLGVPGAINNWLFSITTNPNVIMLMMLGVLFIAGMFLQTNAVIMILSPMLLNIATACGLNPIHFGLVLVIALAIAFVTPPVAVNLFCATSLTGLSVDRVVKGAVPFIIALIVALLVITFAPEITLIFPKLFGMPV